MSATSFHKKYNFYSIIASGLFSLHFIIYSSIPGMLIFMRYFYKFWCHAALKCSRSLHQQGSQHDRFITASAILRTAPSWSCSNSHIYELRNTASINIYACVNFYTYSSDLKIVSFFESQQGDHFHFKLNENTTARRRKLGSAEWIVGYYPPTRVEGRALATTCSNGEGSTKTLHECVDGLNQVPWFYRIWRVRWRLLNELAGI